MAPCSAARLVRPPQACRALHRPPPFGPFTRSAAHDEWAEPLGSRVIGANWPRERSLDDALDGVHNLDAKIVSQPGNALVVPTNGRFGFRGSTLMKANSPHLRLAASSRALTLSQSSSFAVPASISPDPFSDLGAPCNALRRWQRPWRRAATRRTHGILPLCARWVRGVLGGLGGRRCCHR